MEAKYKIPDGSLVQVLNFDKENHMAYVDFGNGEKRWVGKPEYDTWVVQRDTIPDIPAQMDEEIIDDDSEEEIEDKPKSKRKKKVE